MNLKRRREEFEAGLTAGILTDCLVRGLSYAGYEKGN